MLSSHSCSTSTCRGAYVAIIVTYARSAAGQAGVPGLPFLVVAVLLAAGIPIEGLLRGCSL
ncbi:hypothetical protein O9993_10970 [Vibrio lentus]|nr:hypothetical protein [Vibrio lentus]